MRRVLAKAVVGAVDAAAMVAEEAVAVVMAAVAGVAEDEEEGEVDTIGNDKRNR